MCLRYCEGVMGFLGDLALAWTSAVSTLSAILDFQARRPMQHRGGGRFLCAGNVDGGVNHGIGDADMAKSSPRCCDRIQYLILLDCCYALSFLNHPRRRGRRSLESSCLCLTVSDFSSMKVF